MNAACKDFQLNMAVARWTKLPPCLQAEMTAGLAIDVQWGGMNPWTLTRLPALKPNGRPSAELEVNSRLVALVPFTPS